MHENNCRAAGIIVFKKSSKGVKLLGLKALKRFQLMSNGIYDVPKGQIDTGESPFDCAKRECFEETFLKPDIPSAASVRELSNLLQLMKSTSNENDYNFLNFGS